MNSGVPLISFAFLILLVVPALVGIIVLLIKRPAAGVALLCVLGLALLAAMFFVAMPASRVSMETAVRVSPPTVQWGGPEGMQHADPSVQVAAPATRVELAGAEWTDDVFDADMYPDEMGAMKSVASRLAGPVRERLMGVSKAPIFHMRPSGGEDAERLGRMLGMRLREEFPNATIAQVARDTAPLEVLEQGIDVELTVSKAQHAKPQWMAFPQLIGSVQITASQLGTGHIKTVNVEISGKPWATGNADVLHNMGRRWIIARSSRPAATGGEAAAQARSVAGMALFPMVRGRAGQHLGGWHSSNDAWLLRYIEAELPSRGLFVDRFVQSFKRGYGTVWREAILVDASPEKVDQIAQRAADQLRSREHRMRLAGFSAAGLSLTVFLVYLLANSLTKGYFVWRLRAVAVGVLIAVVLVAAMLA